MKKRNLFFIEICLICFLSAATVFVVPGVSFCGVAGFLEQKQQDLPDDETRPDINPACLVDALRVFVLEMMACEDRKTCLKEIFFKVGGCLIGCLNGAERCNEIFSENISIIPESPRAAVPGTSQRLSVSGGRAPYRFALLHNMSGAQLNDKTDGTADYTAGSQTGGLDVVRVEDGSGLFADAFIEITEDGKLSGNVKTIDSSGGVVNGSTGWSLAFPVAAVSSKTCFLLAEDKAAAVFDKQGEPVSPASTFVFTSVLQKPVLLSLPLSGDFRLLRDGDLGIYQLSGETWHYAGGSLEEQKIQTYTQNLTTFIISRRTDFFKSITFYNATKEAATVRVSEYSALQTSPDLSLIASYVWPVEQGERQTSFFPQGMYRFCAEWEEGDDGMFHRFSGDGFPDYTYILDQQSSLISPTQIGVNQTKVLEGSCPQAQDMGIVPEE